MHIKAALRVHTSSTWNPFLCILLLFGSSLAISGHHLDISQRVQGYRGHARTTYFYFLFIFLHLGRAETSIGEGSKTEQGGEDGQRAEGKDAETGGRKKERLFGPLPGNKA